MILQSSRLLLYIFSMFDNCFPLSLPKDLSVISMELLSNDGDMVTSPSQSKNSNVMSEMHCQQYNEK